METDQLTLKAWWINTSCGGLTAYKEELKETEKNLKELNLSELSCLRPNREN